MIGSPSYMAIDGDDVGSRIERFLLEDDADSASRLSCKISRALNASVRILRSHGLEVVMHAGDNLLASGGKEAIDRSLKELRKVRWPGTLSVGIGNNTSDAYLALKYAKSLGGNKICWRTQRKSFIAESWDDIIAKRENFLKGF